MLVRSIVVVLLTSGVLPSLCAQPPATAAKAVADLTGQAAVVESMSTVLRIARDGSTVRTLEVKEHIQSDAGVRSEGIVSVPYASATQTVTFDYVRVRKASGETVETPGDGAQDTPLPVTQQAPMYSDLRYKQLPVRSLGTGDTLEYHITTKDTSSDTQGAMWNPTWFVTTMPVKQETVEVRAPHDFYLMVKSKTTQPTVSEESGERVYRWTHETASEYPKPTKKNTTAQVSVVQEMYEPDIAITSFRSWAEVGAWYRKLIAGRATPDAAIQAKADELTRGLPNDDAKVDAIYRYVATQYRYIAVSFGIGRLRPHEAAEIFRNQYGDCKDKHTLLEAMLKAAKIEAEPVLIGAGVRLNEALPMPSQFDHMITLVKLPGHDVWLDSTPEVAPARMLLTQLRDKLALAIPVTGDAALVRTQATPPFPMYLHETVTGKLGDDGVLTAHFDQTMRGDLEVLYRSAFRQSPRANWQALEQQISYSTGFAGDVSAVDASLPEKTDEPFHVSWDYTRKDFGDWPNRRFPGLTPLFELKLADDATAPERPLTLDSDMEMTVTAKLSLPPGYKLTPPADVRNSTPFAEYVSTYAVKDRTLTMERSLHYTKRELPVKDFAAFRDFAKAVGDDAGQMMQLIGLDAPEVKAAEGPAATGDATTDLIRRAYQKFQSHDTKAARALLDEAKAKDDHAQGLWMSYALVDWSDREKAEADCRRESEYHPEDFAAYRMLNDLYTQDRKWTEAKANLQAWAKADPADPHPYTSLGSLAMMQGQYKDAESHLKHALALSTEPDPIRLLLGRSQIQAGDTEAGKTTLHELMDKSNDAGMLNDAAYELGDAGLDLAADEAASQRSVAMVEQRSNAVKLEQAGKEDFQNTMSLAADWDTLGWILFKENKLPQAESYLQSAWMLLQQPDVGEHLGAEYEAEKKLPEALEIYRQTEMLIGASHLSHDAEQRLAKVKQRVQALKASGIKEKPEPKTESGPKGMAVLRTYTIPNSKPGRFASADFLLLLSANRAEDARLVKGDPSLERLKPAILKTTYRAPLPEGSKAKMLRKGLVACTTGSSTCMLVLLETSQALREE